MKVLSAITAVVIGVPMMAVLAPTVVFAASPPVPSAKCDGANRWEVRYTTSVTNKSYRRAASDVVITIAPGQTSGSRTITASTTFSANVTVSGSVSVNASAILASAKVTAGIALNLGAAWMSGDSVTVGPYKNTTSRYRDAVAFYGTRTVAGEYTKWVCDASPYYGIITWVNKHTNTYRFWNQVVAGMLWCNDDAAIKQQYGAWSIQYNAVYWC